MHLRLGIDGVPAQLAARAALRADGGAVAGQREHLLAGRPEPDLLRLDDVARYGLEHFVQDVPSDDGRGDLGLGRSLLDLVLVLLVVVEDLLRLEEEEIALLVVTDREPARSPFGNDGIFQAHLLLRRTLAGFLADDRSRAQAEPARYGLARTPGRPA